MLTEIFGNEKIALMDVLENEQNQMLGNPSIHDHLNINKLNPMTMSDFE